METFLRDLRFGLRMLAKDARFTAVMVAVLALGIGANTIIFSVVNAVLLQPLPYPDPDRLVQIWEMNLAENRPQGTISPFNFLDWQAQSQSFERMAVYAFSSFSLMEKDGPSRLSGAKISGDFFSVLGAKPMLGRPLQSEDDKPGSRVAVLSHSSWQARFAGDRQVIGKKLTLNGEPYTVIAVMASGFEFPNRRVEIWTPPAFELAGLARSEHFLFGIGRLRRGITLAAAQAEATAIANRLARQYPDWNQSSGINLVPLREQLVGRVRRELLIVWGAVTLVLLIACANVANLLLARVISRQREVSVRFAMGASRARILRQLVTESFLLVVAGGAAGLVLAAWGAHYLAARGIPGIPRSQDIRIDSWVLGFSALTMIVTALLFGITPAAHTGKRGLYALLNQSGWQMPRGSSHHRLSKLVVAMEVGIATVLLITAGLLLKSLYLLHQVDVGFNPKGVLTMQLSLPETLYSDPVQRATIFQQAIARVGALPGIESVGGVNDLPFSGSRTQSSFDILGLGTQSASEPRNADYRTVAGDYFKVMKIPLLKGRTFEPRDGANAPPVAVVNEALARTFLGGIDALGRFLIVQGSTVEVIGVVANLKHDNLAAVAAPEIYVPYSQGHAPEWIFLAARSRPGLEPPVVAIRSAVREVLPAYPLYDIESMEARLDRSIATKRFNTLILSLFASLALILAAVGIYAVIAYAARQRTHEIAIRLALGARRSDVIRLVVVDGFIPAAVGIGLGLAGAVATGRLLTSMLFGIRSTDPMTFALIPALLVATAILASFIPARRATAIDPLTAFRIG